MLSIVQDRWKGGMVDDYVAVKHKRKAANYVHPILESILGETNGVMVYQEQVMRILNVLGDIELAKAYTCIKAISKKKESQIAENAEKFLQGAIAKGLTKKEAEEFWAMILKFAGYGFNKSHSTAYALVAYQTAYLKAHYPVEFMAALLTGDIPGRNFKHKDSLVEHIEDCTRMNIEVVPRVSTPVSRSLVSVRTRSTLVFRPSKGAEVRRRSQSFANGRKEGRSRTYLSFVNVLMPRNAPKPPLRP